MSLRDYVASERIGSGKVKRWIAQLTDRQIETLVTRISQEVGRHEPGWAPRVRAILMHFAADLPKGY